MASNKRESKKAIVTGVLTAIAASSCCVPPLIAAIAGVGSIGSTLSWVEPLRPYLIGVTILAIGYAWFAHLKPKSTDDCGCSPEKPKFYQTKGFLIGVTAFATLSITFPYYSHIFYRIKPSENIVASNTNETQGRLLIKGMTCPGCEHHVYSVLTSSVGVIKAQSSHETGKADIIYDKSIISIEELASLVEKETGYKVTKTEEYGD